MYELMREHNFVASDEQAIVSRTEKEICRAYEAFGSRAATERIWELVAERDQYFDTQPAMDTEQRILHQTGIVECVLYVALEVSTRISRFLLIR